MKNVNVTISFDMDGVLASLYSVEGWLEMLVAEDSTPYEIAKPMMNFSLLAKYLNQLKKYGYKLQVVSWLAKNGNDTYNTAVTIAKIQWLAKHLPSVKWDNIHIVPYGTPKQKYCYTINDILVDDEENNRNSWTGIAYDEKNILEILKKMLDKAKEM